MSGKGSKPRPLSVDRKTFEDNWDTIFGKKDPLQELADMNQQMGFYDDTRNPMIKQSKESNE